MGDDFSSRLTATFNHCPIYFKNTRALSTLLEHMHKKFEINQTKIKSRCQPRRKVLTNNSKSDLPSTIHKQKKPRYERTFTVLWTISTQCCSLIIPQRIIWHIDRSAFTLCAYRQYITSARSQEACAHPVFLKGKAFWLFLPPSVHGGGLYLPQMRKLLAREAFLLKTTRGKSLLESWGTTFLPDWEPIFV